MNRHQLEQQRYRRQATLRRRIEDAQMRDKSSELWRWAASDAKNWAPAGPAAFGYDPGSPAGDPSVVAMLRQPKPGFFRLEDIGFIDDSEIVNPEDGDEPSSVPLAAMELVATHETLDAIQRAIIGARGVGMVRWVDGSAQTVSESEWRRPLFFDLGDFVPYGFAQDPDEQTDERGVPEELVRSLGGKVYERPLMMLAGGAKTMRFRCYTIPELMARAAGHGGAPQ